MAVDLLDVYVCRRPASYGACPPQKNDHTGKKIKAAVFMLVVKLQPRAPVVHIPAMEEEVRSIVQKKKYSSV